MSEQPKQQNETPADPAFVAAMEANYDAVLFAAREVAQIVSAHTGYDANGAELERLMVEMTAAAPGPAKVLRGVLVQKLGEALIDVAKEAHAGARLAVMLTKLGAEDPVADVMGILRQYEAGWKDKL